MICLAWFSDGPSAELVWESGYDLSWSAVIRLKIHVSTILLFKQRFSYLYRSPLRRYHTINTADKNI